MSNVIRYKRSAEVASAILRMLADEELMQLVGEDDSAAFEVLYERHTDAAYALALRMCGRRAAAEDVVQEAVLSIWRSAGACSRIACGSAMRGSRSSWWRRSAPSRRWVAATKRARCVPSSTVSHL